MCELIQLARPSCTIGTIAPSPVFVTISFIRSFISYRPEYQPAGPGDMILLGGRLSGTSQVSYSLYVGIEPQFIPTFYVTPTMSLWSRIQTDPIGVCAFLSVSLSRAYQCRQKLEDIKLSSQANQTTPSLVCPYFSTFFSAGAHLDHEHI